MTKLEEIKDHFRTAPKATRDEVFWLIEVVEEAQEIIQGQHSREWHGTNCDCANCKSETWLRKAGE